MPFHFSHWKQALFLLKTWNKKWGSKYAQMSTIKKKLHKRGVEKCNKSMQGWLENSNIFGFTICLYGGLIGPFCNSCCFLSTYRKIPKISPGASFFYFILSDFSCFQFNFISFLHIYYFILLYTSLVLLSILFFIFFVLMTENFFSFHNYWLVYFANELENSVLGEIQTREEL